MMALVEQTQTALAGTDTGTEGKEIPRGYVEMTFVKETATGRGRNELFIMEDMKNGTIKLTEGRVGITVGRYKPRVSILLFSKLNDAFSVTLNVAILC